MEDRHTPTTRRPKGSPRRWIRAGQRRDCFVAIRLSWHDLCRLETLIELNACENGENRRITKSGLVYLLLLQEFARAGLDDPLDAYPRIQADADLRREQQRARRKEERKIRQLQHLAIRLWKKSQGQQSPKQQPPADASG